MQEINKVLKMFKNLKIVQGIQFQNIKIKILRYLEKCKIKTIRNLIKRMKRDSHQVKKYYLKN